MEFQETEKEITLELPIRGFEKDEIKIAPQKNCIYVSAHKQVEKKTNTENFHRHISSEQSFEYSTTLPSVKPSSLKWKYDGEVVMITLKKE